MSAIAILAVLAGFIVLILCIPLNVTFHIDTYGKPRFRMKLTWLFGLIRKEARKKKPAQKEEKVEKKGPADEKKRKVVILRILRTKGLLRRAIRLVKDVLVRLRIRDLVVDFKVGLDDPADTGLLFAVVGSAALFLRLGYRHRIRVQPVFVGGPVFEGHSHVGVKLWPIQMVPALLRFGFSLATIRGLKVLFASKWREGK